MVLVRAVSAGAALPSVASAAAAAATTSSTHASGSRRASSSRKERTASFSSAATNALLPQRSPQSSSSRICGARAIPELPSHGLSSHALYDNQRRPGLSPSASAAPLRRPFHTSSRAEASVKDPYATLGVKKDASAKEIKSAYYSLAKKFHPDTSKEKGAKERFVEIQSAYDILSDDQKKAAFDRFGTTDGQPGFNPFGGGGGGGPGFDPFGGGGGFGGFAGFQGGARDASDIFEGLFGGAFSSRGRSSNAGFAGEARGEDIDTNINISFEEACRGTTKRVTISPVDRCNTCEGRGMKKDRHKRTCGMCNGTGTRTFVIQSGFQMASTCPACNGAGETVAPGDECGTCEGVGRVRTRKTVEVKVPPGVDDGAKIRMDGQGDVPLQGAGTAGSLWVRIGVRPSKIWRRQGSNLYYPATVPFHTAILGGRVRVPTLDGDVDVRVPSGTQVGDEMLLRGRGVPSLLRRNEKGDLLVQFEVQIPRSLTKRQREILQQYVDDIEGRSPPPQPTPPPPPPPQPQASPSPSTTEQSAGTTSSAAAGAASASSSAQPSSADTSKPAESSTGDNAKASTDAIGGIDDNSKEKTGTKGTASPGPQAKSRSSKPAPQAGKTEQGTNKEAGAQPSGTS